ncbi:MAG: hypothetical protein AAF718_11170 [Pseudomonadota bacterium]
MMIEDSWRAFVTEAVEKFPELDANAALHHESDVTALTKLLAEAHDLTFAEAAEVLTFRLPQYVEPQRLSA